MAKMDKGVLTGKPVTYPIPCPAGGVSLTFQTTISVEQIPKGIQFRQGDVRYESRFVQDGRKVTVHRTLRVQRASNVCGAKENRDWLAFYKVLQRDLRSQIIYR